MATSLIDALRRAPAAYAARTAMSTELLIHATGLCALALNVAALLHRCERTLRIRSGISGIAWALNNLLLGAHTAAALSLVSAGRTALSALTLEAEAHARRTAFIGFIALTFAVGAATWQGWPSAFIVGASMVSTVALFYLRGARLRVSMLLVSALWMYHAWVHGSWEQMAANVATAAAAMVGAWRASRPHDEPAIRGKGRSKRSLRRCRRVRRAQGAWRDETAAHGSP